MKLYKFRSFENIEYTLDIILNERLYCSHHKDLNDPFEGIFSTIEWRGGGVIQSPIRSSISSGVTSAFGGGARRKIYRALSDLPSLDGNTRVCSLSRGMNDIRMWSHYAAAHTGCVIEIEFEERPEIYEVAYSKSLQNLTNKMKKDAKASEILSFKTSHWEYEQEVRIITDREFYSIKDQITGILLGIRTKEIFRKLLINSIPRTIPIFESKMQQSTIDIKVGKRLN